MINEFLFGDHMQKGNFFLFFYSCILFILPLRGSAMYTIEGRVNLGDQWQPRIFMAAIEKLSDYYRASPDLIVNISDIQADGTFRLIGDNLPAAPRFYRLYLMKKQNNDYDACLYGGDDHNFVHLILNNNSKLELQAIAEYDAPFGDYKVLGDKPNQLMKDLFSLVYPSFYFYQIKFPTELKFSEKKLQTDLLHFADTCSSPMVALAAVNHTDFDEYFDQDQLFYTNFGKRLQLELPNSIYTSNYLRKIRYYSNSDAPYLPIWVYFLFATCLILISGLLLKVRRLQTQLKQKGQKTAQLQNTQEIIEKRLTKKEKEILELMLDDKSNKEIATSLFIELSTVKTHINKIYSKLEVKNRQELLNFSKTPEI